MSFNREISNSLPNISKFPDFVTSKLLTITKNPMSNLSISSSSGSVPHLSRYNRRRRNGISGESGIPMNNLARMSLIDKWRQKLEMEQSSTQSESESSRTSSLMSIAKSQLSLKPHFGRRKRFQSIGPVNSIPRGITSPTISKQRKQRSRSSGMATQYTSHINRVVTTIRHSVEEVFTSPQVTGQPSLNANQITTANEMSFTSDNFPQSSSANENHCQTVNTSRSESVSSPIDVDKHRFINFLRNDSSATGPMYSAHFIHKLWGLHCASHALIVMALFPLFLLQSSVTAWWWPDSPAAFAFLFLSPDFGSLILGAMYFVGALTMVFIELIIYVFGTGTGTVLSKIFAFLFFLGHLYPKLYVLLLVYFLMGIGLSIHVGALTSMLQLISEKSIYVLSDDIYHIAEVSPGNTVVSKLATWLILSENLGVALGCVVVGAVLFYSSSISGDTHYDWASTDYMFGQDNAGSRICGAAACPVSLSNGHFSNETVIAPLVHLSKPFSFVASFFVGCGVLAVIISLYLTNQMKGFQDSRRKFSLWKAFRTNKILRHPTLWLLLPASLFMGAGEAFVYSDFMQSYVVCATNISDIKIFLMFGLLRGIASVTISLALQHIERTYILCVGFGLNCCLELVFVLWKPTPDDPEVLYVVAAVWGVCLAHWEGTSYNMLLEVFNQNLLSALGFHYALRFLGQGMMLTASSFLCLDTKIYLLATLLLLAFTSSSAMEYILSKKAQRQPVNV